MDEVHVLKTEEYLHVLQQEGLITFTTVVNGREVNHQIPIAVYDTKEKIEAKMALTLAQVKDEMVRSGVGTVSIPADIEALATPDEVPPDLSSDPTPPTPSEPLA